MHIYFLRFLFIFRVQTYNRQFETPLLLKVPLNMEMKADVKTYIWAIIVSPLTTFSDLQIWTALYNCVIKRNVCSKKCMSADHNFR